MRKVPFIQADVFSDSPFGGNPVVIIPNATEMTREQMQAIARGMSIAKTAFLCAASPESGADFRVCSYTPLTRVAASSHPVLGAAYVWGMQYPDRLVVPVTHARVETDVGVLSVDLYVDSGQIQRVVMTERAPVFGRLLDDLWDLAAALSTTVDKIAARVPCQVVSTGLPALIVPMRSLEALQAVMPQGPGLSEICHNLDADYVLAFSFETLKPGATVHVRVFAPLLGITEDPATGSASSALAAYLIRHRQLGDGTRFQIVTEQGYEVGRPSAVYVEADDATEPMTIKVGGRVWKSIEGSIFF